jgi:L-seryl-tRNA(Ser) seleniumtransferase
VAENHDASGNPHARANQQAQALYRAIPSVDDTLRALPALCECYAHAVLVAEIRRLQEEWRRTVQESGALPEGGFNDHLQARLTQLEGPSLRSVINATGVVLHTNLGRAPLESDCHLPGYSNLEFDLATGARGKRDVHTALLLERLLGRPAIVVNNNAAATYLVLRVLAAGREAIVSRGELVEIGDGFRIPEIMQQAGVVLREVGATNRTHLRDYQQAFGEQSALVVRVHASNFRMEGFVGRPPLSEICQLAHEHGIPVYDDLGSGNLVDLSPAGIDEPQVAASFASGADIVSFSADKLLGGPQAGIIAGRPDLVSHIRRSPMYRAFRADKLILGALEDVLRKLYFQRYEQIPALRMIFLPVQEIARRAEAVAAQMHSLSVNLVEGRSMIGGGSTPAQSLPTRLIAIACRDANAAAAALRAANPPVIARIEKDTLLIDLRTVFPHDEPALLEALQALPATMLADGPPA